MAAWFRTGIVILAMAIVGFLGVWQSSGLFAPRGGLGPTILQAQSPVSALLSVLITISIATVIGGLVAKFTTAATGMFIVGFSLFAMAMKLDGIAEFVWSEGNINMLILEACFIAVLLLLSSFVVFALGGPLKDVRKPLHGHRPSSDVLKSIFLSLAILPVVWIIAKSPLKGQVIGATVVGGIAIGVLTRCFTPSMQPIVQYSLPVAVGGVGYFIANIFGATTVVAFAQQSISPLLFPMPLEYAAGALMGLSIGLGWAVSFASVPEAETA